MTDLQLRAVVADRGVDVEFSVAAGEVLAVLGPNGAGKSTVLHVIAGLVRPDSGRVRLGGRVLTDTAAGVHVATHDRRVGLLLQDPLLFPHLTVAGNVAFALRGTRSARRDTVLRRLREVDTEQLAERRPRQLSGGQAQRVAIARALAAEPEVLLLDEPLSGLDVAAAASVRGVLRAVAARDGRAIVLITHDPLDVLTLADRVLVLEHGRIAELGDATDVLAAPCSRFGARIAGVNLIAGMLAAGGALRTPWGTDWYGIPDDGLATGQQVVAVFPPNAVTVSREPPADGSGNRVAVRVMELDSLGAVIRLRGEEQPDAGPGLAAEIPAGIAATLRLLPGEQVWLSVPQQQVRVRKAAFPQLH